MTIKSYTKASPRTAAAMRKSRRKTSKEMSIMTSPALNKSYSTMRNDDPYDRYALAVHYGRTRMIGNSSKRNSTIEFRLIFSAAFALFLLTSVLERALPHKWSGRSEAGEIRKSVIEQAKEAAHISVGYAFMG